MPYRLVRIDFSDDRKCAFCSRPLTSGKVRILVDDNEHEAHAGPVCTKKNISNLGERVPDFTLTALNGDEPEMSGVGGGRAGTHIPTQTPEDKARNKAISYLLLRIEKLSHLNGMSQPKLAELHSRYQARRLTANDYSYLTNLMNKVDTAQEPARHLCLPVLDQSIPSNRNPDLWMSQTVESGT
ncbi:hypothetical protein [Halopseudomonas xiamenensis]|uniref:hypothetical protein n=1 Tax=Halopseudomonas xiamenensis TaxID=157792 RepID=UPI001626A716|nr:hypothetical protein [Halopseudomonas xiamenensis]